MEDWAIFILEYGKKHFVTKLQLTSLTFAEYDFGVKYSDKSVLKFSIFDAIKICKANSFVGVMIGIMNSEGKQRLMVA